MTRLQQIVMAVHEIDSTIEPGLIVEVAQEMVADSDNQADTVRWLRTADVAEVAAVIAEQF